MDLFVKKWFVFKYYLTLITKNQPYETPHIIIALAVTLILLLQKEQFNHKNNDAIYQLGYDNRPESHSACVWR